MPCRAPRKYEQVASRLCDWIVEGRYPTGKLPREVDLVGDIGFSRVTVNRAVRLLAKRGIVHRVKKKGTSIVGHAEDRLSLLNQIGVVMQSRGHFYASLWSAIGRQLMRNSLFPVSIDPFSSDVPDAEGHLPLNPDFPRALGKLLDSPIRGVMFSGVGYHADPFLAGYPEKKSVCVHCFDAPGAVPPRAVLADYKGGIRLVTEHLIGLGHRDIALLGVLAPGHPLPDPEHQKNNPQYQIQGAFYEAMENAGLAQRATRLLMSGTKREGAITSDDELRGFLARPRRPTAVVCEKDYDAMRVVLRAMELGIHVPGELSVTGLYNTPWAVEAPVPLTTVDFDTETIAQRAVEILIGIREQNAPFVAAPRLVTRHSTGAANGKAVAVRSLVKQATELSTRQDYGSENGLPPVGRHHRGTAHGATRGPKRGPHAGLDEASPGGAIG